MVKRLVWHGCCLGLLLAACAPVAPVAQPNATEPPSLATAASGSATQPKIASPPPLTPAPLATSFLAERGTPQPEPAGPGDNALYLPLEPSAGGSASAAPFSPCSPLAEHPLDQLAEVISGAYEPPPPGREERHHGVDFAYYQHNGRDSIAGEVVQSVLAGTVAAALADSFPYGNLIIVGTPVAQLPEGLRLEIEAGEGEWLYLLYAHLEGAPQAALGEAVAACQPLGAAGRSGNAGVAHLHIEMRLGPPGANFPEMDYYLATSSGSARQAYLRWRTSGEFRHFDPLRVLQFGLTSVE